MKKSIIILTAIALIAGGCGQKTSKQQKNTEETFDKSTVLFRPNEKIQRGKIYTDTLAYNGVGQSEYGKFQEFGFGGDAYYFTIAFNEKKSDLPLLRLDDMVEIKWKIDEAWFENPNLFVLNALSVKKISSEHKVKYRLLMYNNDKKTEDYKLILFFEDGKTKISDYSPDDEFPYEEYPTFLLLENERRDLFDGWGHIEPYWEIINYHKVNSRMQITNFEEKPEKIAKANIQNITETCLILIAPEQNEEPDEEYDEVMEWSMYAYDRQEEYEAKGIKSVNAGKRYLSFALADGEKIVIDTKKEQNGQNIPPTVLLYKKGQIPILLSITGESDEGKEMVEKYLRK